MKRTMLLLALVLLAATCCSATVWYVDASATGANNGTSWLDAFTAIQAAVNEAAVGDDIWVKAGTYTDDEDGDGTDSFLNMPGNGDAVDILGQENEMRGGGARLSPTGIITGFVDRCLSDGKRRVILC